MSLNITIKPHEIRVEDTDSGRTITHVDDETNFRAMTDTELTTLINDRLGAMRIEKTVSETEIPADSNDELIAAIQDASTLEELKDALTGNSRPAQAQGRPK